MAVAGGRTQTQMPRKRSLERRIHERFTVESEIRGHELRLLGFPEKRKKTIRGLVEDISSGGLCVRTSAPLTVSFPIRCELPFSKVPVSVPLILKVRWTQKTSPKAQQYRSGLQFLV